MQKIIMFKKVIDNLLDLNFDINIINYNGWH